MRIALISDTHGHLDPLLFKYADTCDEIWHAGDIGAQEGRQLGVLEELRKFKPLRAVFGNIDDGKTRKELQETLEFELEGLKVFITHIGGYPGHYAPGIKAKLLKKRPGLFICGHSHILKVIPDKELGLLHMNPGAAGIHGFHTVKTMLRFTIREGKVQELQAIELGKRA
ncbi:MAG: metallophosphoesterase family protein [Bacteroidia bacterium]|nr:metallophosphoesterase family protein [Bacteroidia bacterium]